MLTFMPVPRKYHRCSQCMSGAGGVLGRPPGVKSSLAALRRGHVSQELKDELEPATVGWKSLLGDQKEHRRAKPLWPER